MTWSFRLRFVLGDTSGFLYPTNEWTLERTEGVHVCLRSIGTDEIRTARSLALWGSGYPSEPEANSAGAHWRARLIRAFSCLRVAADFGDRAPKSSFTAYGLQMAAPGQRALNDVHGLMVFETEPSPVFLGMTPPRAWQSPPNERVEEAVTAAKDHPQSDEGLQVAYDILAASFSERHADARFALLMIALESLIELQPRTAEAKTVVDNLISHVRYSTLEPDEVRSMVSSLGWLRTESIGQAGRRLAATLEPRRYMELPPISFFTKCYDLRSRLVHGHRPFPSRAEVDGYAAQLEVFVADLLCAR